MRRSIALPVVVAAVAVVGGCGGTRGDDSTAPVGPTHTTRGAKAPSRVASGPAPRCAGGTTRSYAGRGVAVVLRRPASAAIGRPETPTPTGSYYVNQRLLAADPGGPWGPGGIGISAFSPVLLDWPQGGPIAIHGTNRPESIGLAASNGCVRIDNGVLARLIRVVPDGTPVRIRA